MDNQVFSALLSQARKQHPLVHHITNYVTVNDCANITICAGGAPVMADAAEEAGEMASLSGSLVLNIGPQRRNYQEHASCRKSGE